MKMDGSSLDGKTVLVTGAAGFIGYHLAKELLASGVRVVGYDNVNDYYDVGLKNERLRLLEQAACTCGEFIFIRGDLADRPLLSSVFVQYHPQIVVSLAAQVGVRYSIENPDAYMNSNVMGFYNLLETCRHEKEGGGALEHLVYASSSSVYGSNEKVPYSVRDRVDTPVSLYAATKKSDELMAHVYSHLFGIPATGLRFFTVYGPFGRPDMAYFRFTDRLVRGERIQLYNNGDMYRDFTYVDDIVKGIVAVMQRPPRQNGQGVRCRIYNIGNSRPESLLHFVDVLEQCLLKEGLIDRPGTREFLPMQPGDVYRTYADVGELERDFGFKPATSLEDGLARYAGWYRGYYGR